MLLSINEKQILHQNIAYYFDVAMKISNLPTAAPKSKRRDCISANISLRPLFDISQYSLAIPMAAFNSSVSPSAKNTLSSFRLRSPLYSYENEGKDTCAHYNTQTWQFAIFLIVLTLDSPASPVLVYMGDLKVDVDKVLVICFFDINGKYLPKCFKTLDKPYPLTIPTLNAIYNL